MIHDKCIYKHFVGKRFDKKYRDLVVKTSRHHHFTIQVAPFSTHLDSNLDI